jgi:hypothetical protein
MAWCADERFCKGTVFALFFVMSETIVRRCIYVGRGLSRQSTSDPLAKR